MKHVVCADLVAHCPAEFHGPTMEAVFEQYALHAGAEHDEPVKVIDLMLSIGVA